MDGGRSKQARIAGGYGALLEFLTAGCPSHCVAIHLGSAVSAIEATDGKVMVRCTNGDVHDCDTVILTVPLPLLKEIALPAVEREKAAAAAHIGFGNVIKILLRFETHWWIDKQKDFADLTFLLSDARIPVWWTQHPAEHPVLTGWFGGPKTEGMARLNERELIEAGLASLASRSRHSPAPTARPFSCPAKHSTAGATWALSRQRWPADLRSRGPFWPLISQQMRYCVGKITRSSADLFGAGRTFRAGVADRFENFGDCDGRRFRREAGRRLLASNDEGAFAGVRICAVLHPAVLFAFADGASF
jgi:hypothetical protein